MNQLSTRQGKLSSETKYIFYSFQTKRILILQSTTAATTTSATTAAATTADSSSLNSCRPTSKLAGRPVTPWVSPGGLPSQTSWSPIHEEEVQDRLPAFNFRREATSTCYSVPSSVCIQFSVCLFDKNANSCQLSQSIISS